MARTLRFYSRQEMTQLRKIAKLEKSERKAALLEFSKENKRPFDSARIKLSNIIRKKKPARKVKDASLITSPNSKKGEFVIPVKSWKLQHNNGDLNIVINF